MAALASALPAPMYNPVEEVEQGPARPIVSASANIPKYGKRKGWKPKAQQDFGLGGAYPEVRSPYITTWLKVVRFRMNEMKES